MPADRAQANQGVGKEPKRIPASLRDIPARKLGKALSRTANRQNGVRDQASHSRKQQTARPHSAHCVHSVTKDQLGWGFTVKQGATIIHEDSAVYTVSTSSLTMEMEAVTGALCWTVGPHITVLLTDSMSLLQKVKNGMGSPDWNMSMIGTHLSKTPVGVLPWTCRSEGKWPSRQTVRKSNPPKWLASRKL